MKTFTLSIRFKLIIAMLMAVIVSTSIVSYIGYSKSKELLVSRLQQSDLPNLLQRIRNSVDGNISEMKVLTKAIASNPFLQEWIESGANAKDETKVIKMLAITAADNNLSNASFADRKTNNYWNQGGFLRTLKAESASTYTYDNGKVDVFVNYQQVNGRGVAGVSKSFDDMVKYLKSFKIEKSGFVYLVDSTGLIKIHEDKTKTEKETLTDIYQNLNAKPLLAKQGFAFQETKDLIVATSYIPSLGWYVVAQVPKAELYKALDTSRNHMLFWFFIIIFSFVVISFVLAKSLTKPINDLASLFKELGEGEGDLSYRLNEHSGDEVAHLAVGFNAFISKIHMVVSDLSQTSEEVRKSSLNVYQNAEKSSSEAQEQSDIATQVATAISEMGSTIADIAGNASEALEATNEATSQTKMAKHVVETSTANILKMVDDMESVSMTIESLANKSDTISSVIDVIRSISEQTNLLALNAAIEAARAGEQGRGFAVVADEVRNLAQRTSESTDEINAMITQLQEESKLAVEDVRKSKETAEAGSEDAHKTNQVLEDIVAAINHVSDLNTQVATATEEQAAVVNEINIHVNTINDSTQNSAETASNIALSSEQLTTMASRLESLVKRFKI